MAIITQEISIDVAEDNRIHPISAKQGDQNSRFLKVTVTKYGEKINIDSDSAVTINAHRPDDKIKSFVGSINDDGTLMMPLSPWMLSLDGMVKCDISIYDSMLRRLNTMLFFIRVEISVDSDEGQEDDQSYELLTTLIESVKGAVRSASSAAELANESARNADTALNQAISEANTTLSVVEQQINRLISDTQVDVNSLLNAVQSASNIAYQAQNDANAALESISGIRLIRRLDITQESEYYSSFSDNNSEFWDVFTIPSDTECVLGKYCTHLSLSLTPADQNDGFAHEWIMIIPSGYSSVSLPNITWTLGIAPAFTPGKTTEIRLHYVGNKLVGVWNEC